MSVDPTLAAHRSVSLLRVDDGPTILAVTPERASDLELVDGGAVDAAEDDLDEAFVELDHWLVFGTFVDGEWHVPRACTPGARPGSRTSG